MTVQIGDKVRFLSDVGSGTVVRIDKNIAFVSDEDGFERPSPLSQIVVIESISTQQKRAIKDDVISKNEDLKASTKQISKKIENDNALYLALHPQKFPFSESDNIELYLLNDTNNVALYHIYSLANDMATTLKAGFLEPNTRESILAIKINKLDTTIGYQVIQYQAVGKFSPLATLNGQFKFKSLDILQSKTFKLNPFFAHQTLLFTLNAEEHHSKQDLLEKYAKSFPPIAKEIIAPAFDVKKNKPNINDILEIDLHIEQLRDDLRHLLPHEILPIQMEHFHKIMRQNLPLKGKRIVFIHGVGAGTLKGELLKVLSKNYPKCEVQDASFQEYGFGATRVTIR